MDVKTALLQEAAWATKEPIELDYKPNEFMDDQKQWIICSTHGAIYHPASGECISGPCRGEILEKLNVTESNDVLWVEIY